MRYEELFVSAPRSFVMDKSVSPAGGTGSFELWGHHSIPFARVTLCEEEDISRILGDRYGGIALMLVCVG